MDKLILFSGQCCSGKDQAANFLAELLQLKTKETWHRMAFADAVKDIFCQSFGVSRQFIEDWKRNPEPPPGFKNSIRKSLQFIGDGFRNIFESCWIDMAIKKIKGNSIISDGRYKNEGKAICEKEGINILVWRPGYENDDPNKSEAEIKELIDYCLATGQNGPIRLSTNPRPQGIEKYHYFLRNDGNIDKLNSKITEDLLPYITENFYCKA